MVREAEGYLLTVEGQECLTSDKRSPWACGFCVKDFGCEGLPAAIRLYLSCRPPREMLQSVDDIVAVEMQATTRQGQGMLRREAWSEYLSRMQPRVC
jgi:hypothetical protein